ncbi:multicopper oxidase family protein [Nocardioides ganghwensis]|uniref:Bilirubin oxidase n=1 Tax=Nocardioides ganghwensis TaxID=252230 RepID=A0A4Q2S8Q1_9ACTN|nr:multicopper oxidase [Nocardioides ganghwensis]MBD3947438.1 multicopper oxidase domain-containing protein [Nocardioides ganghwensis]RYB99912.1 bilirubin oxidase [Nocardioides ganghwensis]
MPGHEPVRLGRRTFIAAAGAGVGFTLYARLPGGATRALAAIPGGTLAPEQIPKYVSALLVPPVMPRAGTIRQQGGANVDYYEISMRQFSQQVLPAGLPATTVWGYGAVSAGSARGLKVHHAPSLTIEAQWNRPVRVKWINDLVDPDGNYLPHLLPIDPTLHWANPPGGEAERDGQPSSLEDPKPYTGPVPMVTHLHGAVAVGDESDGYPEAWYLPAAEDIPAGYAHSGTWYDFFAGKAASRFGVTWGPGFATFQYPNPDRARTEWYHDHSLGMTRANVYAGPAGFYLIRGGPSGDKAVLDTRSGTTAVLPGPAPKEGDDFPSRKEYGEIALAIQDRAFNADGSLFYPDSREFFDGATAEAPGFIPDTDLSPIWNPEFFGNTIIVNGTTWPFATVRQRRYRLRMLNGCQSRFLILDFTGIPGVEVWQIGNEGGFLPAPVNLTADHGNRLLMALAERADLIVDFTHVPVGSHVLGNVGPDEPFGGGEPVDDFDAADPDSTGQVMQFRVVPAVAPDPTTPPQFLQLPAITPLPAASTTRRLALIEMMSASWDGPAQALLGTVDGSGMPREEMWADPVTENPTLGSTEVWEFYNFTADAHPIHVHEVAFEVVDRQALVTNDDGETEPPARLVGVPRAPEAWEVGVKDTVIAYPGEVTRVKARFLTAGRYVWHCHILEHEDNEMMRPYQIGPDQPGQPPGRHV